MHAHTHALTHLQNYQLEVPDVQLVQYYKLQCGKGFDIWHRTRATQPTKDSNDN